MNKFIYAFLGTSLLIGCSGSEEDSLSNGQEKIKDDDSLAQPSYSSGLLLGVHDYEQGARTYWIKFSDSGAEIDSVMDCYLSPQKDGFYIIQEVNGEGYTDCEFEDYDGMQTNGQCTWDVTELLIVKPDQYESKYNKKQDHVKSLARSFAECGESGSDFESVVYIGNGFIEYTVGGASHECAPDGPGGGFEQDTVIGIGSSYMSPYVQSYLDSDHYNDVYSKLNGRFKNEDGSIDTNAYDYFEQEKMPVHFTYQNGRVAIYARNTSGRNHQDTWEEEVFADFATDKNQSNEFPEYGEEVIREEVEGANYLISPIDSVYGLYIYKEQKVVFYSYPSDKILFSFNVGWADVIMVEWCDSTNLEKWGSKVTEVKGMIK